MFRVKISYYYIKSDHIFATPEFHNSEILEAKSLKDIYKYISSKKDLWGNKFVKQNPVKYGFDYISSAGGIKIEPYNPKIKKI